MMTDPIADMLTRIRNAQMTKKGVVEMPHSKLKKAIAEILHQEGYVGEIKEEPGIPAKLILVLKYNGKTPAIQSIKRESKPGHRIYKKADEMPRILNDYGIAIVSTSNGLMTNKKARKLGMGGEIICSVY
ncbi:30S ribosomal protein S8 [Patescibacteria group bacterium]|nr:30S ribosomal protein S8 [Patescibacteria group bacterium]MBU1895788.1 30S ribosomal protein S8 [Patescibacteria group bacterium]